MGRHNRQTPRKKRLTQSVKPKRAPKRKKSYMPKKGYGGGRTTAGPEY